MANYRVLKSKNGILRRHFGMGEFLKFNYYLPHLPINPVVRPPIKDFVRRVIMAWRKT